MSEAAVPSNAPAPKPAPHVKDNAIIRFENVVKRFGDNTVLDGMNFSVARTPPAILKKMAEATRQALARESLAQQIRTAGALPKSSTPQELRDHIAGEIKRWTEVVDKAGIPQQ